MNIWAGVMFSLKQCLDAAFPSVLGPRSEVRSGLGEVVRKEGFLPSCSSSAPSPCPFFPADHVQGEPGERVLCDRRRGPHARCTVSRLLLHHQPLHAHPRGPQQESTQVLSLRVGRLSDSTDVLLRRRREVRAGRVAGGGRTLGAQAGRWPQSVWGRTGGSLARGRPGGWLAAEGGVLSHLGVGQGLP